MSELEDLDVHLQHLVGLEEVLAAALVDSDPVLWAAHESVLCVRSLLSGSTRAREEAHSNREDDLTAAMAQMRSAVTAIRIAVTDAGHRADPELPERHPGERRATG